MFKTGSKESFDRIRRIFVANSAEPVFYLGVISNMISLEVSSATNVYSYSGIQTGIFDEETNSLFTIEKCVLYEHSNRIVPFIDFPI